MDTRVLFRFGNDAFDTFPPALLHWGKNNLTIAPAPTKTLRWEIHDDGDPPKSKQKKKKKKKKKKKNKKNIHNTTHTHDVCRADLRFAPSQWEGVTL